MYANTKISDFEESGVVVQVYNPSIWESEGMWIWCVMASLENIRPCLENKQKKQEKNFKCLVLDI